MELITAVTNSLKESRTHSRVSKMRVVLVLLVAVAVLVAVVGLLWSQQRRLIYYPAPRAVPPAATVLPGAEEVSFPTEDGLRLAGWFVPATGPPGRRPGQPRSPAVLVCNGNAGNRSLRAPLAAALARAGLAVLLFDYRGYAANPGRPTEAGLAADARAAVAYLAARPEVDPARLVYFGESIGAAVALRLAVERPPAALVLRSPFASLAEVGRGTTRGCRCRGCFWTATTRSGGSAGWRPRCWWSPASATGSSRWPTAGGCSTPPRSRSGSCSCPAPATTTSTCSPALTCWTNCWRSSATSVHSARPGGGEGGACLAAVDRRP